MVIIDANKTVRRIYVSDLTELYENIRVWFDTSLTVSVEEKLYFRGIHFRPYSFYRGLTLDLCIYLVEPTSLKTNYQISLKNNG